MFPEQRKIYGYVMRSSLALPGLDAAEHAVDLELTEAKNCHRRWPFELSEATRLYPKSVFEQDLGVSPELYALDDKFCLRIPHLVKFYFGKGSQVFYQADATATRQVVAALFLGPLCATWLEMRGYLCLHASSVRIKNTGVAFIGASGAGKSTLLAAMLAAGFPLLSDDILPLLSHQNRCAGIPSFPRLKLDSNAARLMQDVPQARFEGLLGSERLWRVGDMHDCFVQERCNLSVVYCLDRAESGNTEIEIRSLSPSESFVELLRHSFCAHLVDAVGSPQKRMSQVADIAKRVSVRRLRIPSGIERLGEICHAVRTDALLVDQDG